MPASTSTTHEHCTICDWLGREAERTARRFGSDRWTNETVDARGRTHTAHYERSRA